MKYINKDGQPDTRCCHYKPCTKEDRCERCQIIDKLEIEAQYNLKILRETGPEQSDEDHIKDGWKPCWNVYGKITYMWTPQVDGVHGIIAQQSDARRRQLVEDSRRSGKKS